MRLVVRLLLTAVVASALVSGCGDEVVPAPEPEAQPSTVPGERPTTTPAAPGEVLGFATVLDDGDGAELCLGGQADSYPPQCGGPPLVGWDWAEHEGDFEEASGVRWGEFAVTGTFDGTTITPSEVIPDDEYQPPPYEESRDLTSPCPVPEGGWRVLDPARTTQKTESQAIRAATKLDGFAEAWVDQSINPLSALDDNDPAKEQGMNDPTKLVLNISTAGDVARTEAVVREIWGGALCVSAAGFSDEELEPIQEAMSDVPGFAGSSRGAGRVDVWVTYDDGSIQAWVDEEYGEGVVLVTSALVDVG